MDFRKVDEKIIIKAIEHLESLNKRKKHIKIIYELGSILRAHCSHPSGSVVLCLTDGLYL